MNALSFSGLSDVELDLRAITAAATRLGPETAELWRSLRARAEAELERHTHENTSE